ncbi:MAG TPA: histidine phosphatase family protein [Candidatus Paceibacterota bacterium]
MNKHESGASPESQEKMAKIVLHFFRHGEQLKDPDKTDTEYDLSPVGREQARKKAETVGDSPNLGQTMAFGSPRKRSQQTAAFAMASEALDTIDGTESLEELKKKLQKDVAEGQNYGSKVMVDPRLNFFMDKETPFGKAAYDAFATRKEYLRFLAEDSDKLAREVKDERGSTYSRQAGGIAEIVQKYIGVLPRWEELVESGKYNDSKLERFMGSHGGVTESFLLKVIEKTKGVAERDKLVALMPNGFDFTEGFDVAVTDQGGGQEPIIHLTYKKMNEKEPEKTFEFDEDLTSGMVDQIIAEKVVADITYSPKNGWNWDDTHLDLDYNRQFFSSSSSVFGEICKSLKKKYPNGPLN